LLSFGLSREIIEKIKFNGIRLLKALELSFFFGIISQNNHIFAADGKSICT